MYNINIKVKSPTDMIKLGKILTNVMYPNLVLAMNGDLGAGKTTFTKGIGEAFGISRVINSPTFTIMKVYDTNHLNNIEKLYHLDVYRLSSSESDFELEEYFYLNGLTVIEWADIIEDILPNSLWKVYIENISDTERLFKLSVNLDTDFENIKKLLGDACYEVTY